jgi:hypothetical protein
MDIQQLVISFFKDKTGIKNIDENTNISSPEYGIFDLDAEFIMKLFFKEFNIDDSGFYIEDYFQFPDYTWKNLFLVHFFFKNDRPIKKELTIKHLSKVAERGSWV